MVIRTVLLCALTALSGWSQKVQLVEAAGVYFPGVADSNSPVHWANGMRYVYNSDGFPIRSEGVDLGRMRYARGTFLLNSDRNPWWMEATYRHEDGTIYGWYHHEQYQFCPTDGDQYMGVPVIGAIVSKDNGRTFVDLGPVLEDGSEAKCDAKNGYFAGGHGDFSVVLDREKKYFYFYFSAYGGTAEQQGVAIARMAFADRDAPAGKVWKYFDGKWESEGLGGPVTPVFPARTPWESEFADAFWGPSVHWNRELGEFVMLLNRACCAPGWPAEGIYVSFNADPSNPAGWSEPERLVEGGGWYPVAVGLEEGDTDKEAGARARFFMGSDSHWELIFRKGERGISPVRIYSRQDVETRRRTRPTFKSTPPSAAGSSASAPGTRPK